MIDDIKTLTAEWIRLKEVERQAVDERRQIEDLLMCMVNTKQEGSATTNAGDYQIKVTTRLNRRINSDLLQDIAAENGLTDHLSTLFRWKPDLNMSAWKAADPSITEPLLDAITTTEGRPSFNITTAK